MTLSETRISIQAGQPASVASDGSSTSAIPSTRVEVRNLRFVLVESSRPGNIGAVARAMKTMGFSDLILVNPRFADALSSPEAVAFASGAQDVLANARIVGSFSEAVEGCHFAAAVSARLREFSPPVTTPRSIAEFLGAASTLTSRTAVVFGSERFGLPNDIVEKCNFLINIPANPVYSSLNLAQAAQIIAYECRLAGLNDRDHAAAESIAATAEIAGSGERMQAGAEDFSLRSLNSLVGASGEKIGFQGNAAGVSDIDAMFDHLEKALIALDFLDPDNPKKLMPRLRRLFSRTRLETEEVNIFRGIARQILQPKKAKLD